MSLLSFNNCDETEPIYPLGKRAMQKLFCDSADQSILPLLKDSITRVVIVYKIDTTGKVTDIRADDCEDSIAIAEGIRLVRLMVNWIPATRNGARINSYKRQPFTFSKLDCREMEDAGSNEKGAGSSSVCCSIFYND